MLRQQREEATSIASIGETSPEAVDDDDGWILIMAHRDDKVLQKTWKTCLRSCSEIQFLCEWLAATITGTLSCKKTHNFRRNFRRKFVTAIGFCRYRCDLDAGFSGVQEREKDHERKPFWSPQNKGLLKEASVVVPAVHQWYTWLHPIERSMRFSNF